MTSPALPTSDPPVVFFDAPEGRLAYVDEGPRDAPALVMLHGIPGSVRDFRYLAPQLVPRVRVIRVDLPGFGASAVRDDAVDSLPGRAQAIVSLADHLQLPRFAVLGHSMGGGTALVLAQSRPARVSHLVLVASVALSLHRGLGRAPWRFALIARAVGVPLLGGALLRAAREQYRRRGFPGADTIDATTLRLHLRAIAATDFRLLRQAVKSPLPPTLVAYAHDDHMVERWISEQLVAALSTPRVLAFSEGGHNLQKTRAVELAAAVGDWLGA